MAKTKTTAPKRSKSTRKKWPASGSLKLWLECYLDSCEQLSKPSRSTARAVVRLRQLAECGYEANAIKRVERLIALLAPTDIDSYVRLARVGAEICLEIPNLKRAEKYLVAIDKRLTEAPRSKQTLLAGYVEFFRIRNGLAEADDSSDVESQIGKYRHEYRQAWFAGDHRRALAAIRRVTKRIPDVDNQLIETPGTAAVIAKASTIRNAKRRRETLIELYAKCRDWPQVAKHLDAAPNVEEVHQLIHAVLYKLPGGARL